MRVKHSKQCKKTTVLRLFVHPSPPTGRVGTRASVHDLLTRRKSIFSPGLAFSAPASSVNRYHLHYAEKLFFDYTPLAPDKSEIRLFNLHCFLCIFFLTALLTPWYRQIID